MRGQYLKLVPKSNISVDGNGTTVAASADAEVYKPLAQIRRPAGNSHADWTETVEIVYVDGHTETVRGHIVASGPLEDSGEVPADV